MTTVRRAGPSGAATTQRTSEAAAPGVSSSFNLQPASTTGLVAQNQVGSDGRFSGSGAPSGSWNPATEAAGAYAREQWRSDPRYQALHRRNAVEQQGAAERRLARQLPLAELFADGKARRLTVSSTRFDGATVQSPVAGAAQQRWNPAKRRYETTGPVMVEKRREVPVKLELLLEPKDVAGAPRGFQFQVAIDGAAVKSNPGNKKAWVKTGAQTSELHGITSSGLGVMLTLTHLEGPRFKVEATLYQSPTGRPMQPRDTDIVSRFTAAVEAKTEGA